jgi:HPt (histidine-containing phosphotransfer) domain-containing protein
MNTLTAAPETGDMQADCRVASAARPTFDIDELLKRCMSDRLLAARLVDRFVTRLANALYELQCSLDAEDWSTAASQAHRLKGEAGNLAASDVFAASAQLEECLVRGCFGDASGHFAALRLSAEECERTRWTTIQELSQPA